ncbi:MAG: hypothetical protein ACI8RD_009048, partial [Bacillariaceae sp.]
TNSCWISQKHLYYKNKNSNSNNRAVSQQTLNE